jgi:hypothetical protein
MCVVHLNTCCNLATGDCLASGGIGPRQECALHAAAALLHTPLQAMQAVVLQAEQRRSSAAAAEGTAETPVSALPASASMGRATAPQPVDNQDEAVAARESGEVLNGLSSPHIGMCRRTQSTPPVSCDLHVADLTHNTLHVPSVRASSSCMRSPTQSPPDVSWTSVM